MVDDLETMHRVIEMEIVEDHRAALDAGAGDGAWARLMSVHFNKVFAYEADRDTFQALLANVGDLGNVDMHCQRIAERALGRDADGASRSVAIDDLGLESCGLIRIALGGSELLALRGAEKTLRRCRPILAVEFNSNTGAVGQGPRSVHGFILGSGYREVFRTGAYRVFAPH